MPRAYLATVLIVVLALALVGCTGSDGPSSVAASREVVELKSADPLRQAFAESEGEPRLLLLLSPT